MILQILANKDHYSHISNLFNYFILNRDSNESLFNDTYYVMMLTACMNNSAFVFNQ